MLSHLSQAVFGISCRRPADTMLFSPDEWNLTRSVVPIPPHAPGQSRVGHLPPYQRSTVKLITGDGVPPHPGPPGPNTTLTHEAEPRARDWVGVEGGEMRGSRGLCLVLLLACSRDVRPAACHPRHTVRTRGDME
ncbi:hypothetical protein V2G26_017861 [Clonostachys chloroleuca]